MIRIIKKPIFAGWFGKPKIKFREPLLLLIRRTGEIETLEGVKAGIFELKSVLDKTKNRSINLNPNKLLNLKYGGNNLKCWIAYEDEANVYPLDVERDSRELHQILKMMSANYKMLDVDALFNRKTIKWIMIILFVIAAAVVLAWQFGLFTPTPPNFSGVTIK